MQVVVVGGGHSGTLVANRVAKKVKDGKITVINPRPDFVERVRLHQQIAGTYSAATPLLRWCRCRERSRWAHGKARSKRARHWRCFPPVARSPSSGAV